MGNRLPSKYSIRLPTPDCPIPQVALALAFGLEAERGRRGWTSPFMILPEPCQCHAGAALAFSGGVVGWLAGCGVGRLKAMPPRLRPLAPRLKALPKVAERFYLSAEWRDYRRRHKAWTVARVGALYCARCGGNERLILDHKVERKDGGADFPAFDQAEWLCGPCHNTKTAAARGRRARGGR